MRSATSHVWLWFATSFVIPFALLAIGFRLFYDSVIPEVAGLVVTGAIFGYLRPRHAWLWAIGIAIGIVLSERVFPATPPAEHIARYGRPIQGGLLDLLKICALPTAGVVVGAISRLLLRSAFGLSSRNRLARCPPEPAVPVCRSATARDVRRFASRSAPRIPSNRWRCC